MGRPKKYNTEEERRQGQLEAHKRYYQKHKEKIIGSKKKYYETHKEQYSEYHKEYMKTHEEEQKQYRKQYYEENAEKIKEYIREYRKTHKDTITKYHNEYCNKTPLGRAWRLLAGYISSDKQYNRGNGDLTAKWIVENIFTKPCAHCGETDWTKIGCNRIDNSKPHTKDNVEPCCAKCNRSLPRK